MFKNLVLTLLIVSLSSCSLFKSLPEKRTQHKKQRVGIKIKLNNSFRLATINADVYRPIKKIKPKTLVIIVPASGKVSRRGEVYSDGLNNYDNPVYQSRLWAKALAKRGMFVLAYDKRSCKKNDQDVCMDNDTSDIKTLGIKTLADDLDEIYMFAKKKFLKNHELGRIILLSHTQGAQTISLSKAKNKASGIILISPVLEDLSKNWPQGLRHAAKNKTNQAKVNDLLNRAKNIEEFFESIKANKFPESAMVHGASIHFWKTWLKASKETLSALIKTNKPIKVLFSRQDAFFNEDFVFTAQTISSSLFFSIYKNVDRNFITKNQAPTEAFDDITQFIHTQCL